MHVCMYMYSYIRGSMAQYDRYGRYVCMYVCMYMYSYIRVSMTGTGYMFVCLYVCMYACMYVCTYIATIGVPVAGYYDRYGRYVCMYVCMYMYS